MPEKPLFTVVVPHRETEPVTAPLAGLARARTTPLEVLAVSGNQPSHQRNLGIKKARGTYVYFLDNDAEPDPGNLALAAELFARHPEVAVVGGPSLTPTADSALSKAFGAVLSSPWGTFPIRARYAPVGRPRVTSDRALILCNLAVRKAVLDEVGGFDERLYPNEENELMDRVTAAGHQLFYHPRFAVHRGQRRTWKEYFRQLFGYGRGRAEQLRADFRVANLAPFVFLGFPLYLAAWPVLVLAAPLLALPLAAYTAGCLAFSLPAYRAGWKTGLLSVPAFLVCHLGYGLGLWRGLLLPFKSQSVTPVARLRRLKA